MKIRVNDRELEKQVIEVAVMDRKTHLRRSIRISGHLLVNLRAEGYAREAIWSMVKKASREVTEARG